MRASYRPVMAGMAAVLILAGSVSCGDVVRQGNAPAMIVVDLLQAASGATPATLGGFLLSDVQTIVDDSPTIFNDVGQATMHLIAKDVGNGQNSLAPTPWNSVTLKRYRIVYRRADGRDKPEDYGVNVPFPVEGALTATITSSPIVVPFELVRHQQKLEQPLRSLANFGGRLFISTMAEVTFYGADQVGNEVQAQGTISVSFGDYADPNS